MGRLGAVAILASAALARPAAASDHLDTPTVIADPAADLADLFAWTSADGKRLNLVMTVVAHQLSDRLQYVFHVDSAARLGDTVTSTPIACRFDGAGTTECWVGDADYARGDASQPAGLTGQRHRFQVFAGLRDDPFFNNVKGTRDALDAVAAALPGAPVDAAGCPQLPAAVARDVRARWRHTAGGPAVNLLAGWSSAAIVVSVDLDVVRAGGPLLAVWAGTYKP